MRTARVALCPPAMALVGTNAALFIYDRVVGIVMLDKTRRIANLIIDRATRQCHKPEL